MKELIYVIIIGLSISVPMAFLVVKIADSMDDKIDICNTPIYQLSVNQLTEATATCKPERRVNVRPN